MLAKSAVMASSMYSIGPPVSAVDALWRLISAHKASARRLLAFILHAPRFEVFKAYGKTRSIGTADSLLAGVEFVERPCVFLSFR